MTCFVFSNLKLEFSFQMSVLRPSETDWSSRYGLFCVAALKLEISFKMSVLGPSETPWGSRYDRSCVFVSEAGDFRVK